jgi:hypothetical protein
MIGELGLTEKLLKLGARFARDAAFFAGKSRSGARELPQPALCISRFTLDHALSHTLRELGGELREGERWRERNFGEGVVCATGRRAYPTDNGWRWFGLKVHARGVSLEADLEMHFGRDFYVGLCRLEMTRSMCADFSSARETRRPAASRLIGCVAFRVRRFTSDWSGRSSTASPSAPSLDCHCAANRSIRESAGSAMPSQ